MSLNHINQSIIIIDFDGTLIILETDWNALRLKLKDYCKKELNIDETFENIDKSLFKIRRQYGNFFFKNLLQIVSLYEIQGYKGKIVEQVFKFLTILSSNKKIAIFSSNCRKTIETIISTLNLNISYIVAKDDVNEPKPSGEGIQKILTYFNAQSKDAIFIGDSENDIKAGRNAKVKTILWKELLQINYLK